MQFLRRTNSQRAIFVVIVCILIFTANTSISRSANATPSSLEPVKDAQLSLISTPPAQTDILAGRGPTPTLDPPRDPGPIPTIGGGTVTIEPITAVPVTRRP